MLRLLQYVRYILQKVLPRLSLSLECARRQCYMTNPTESCASNLLVPMQRNTTKRPSDQDEVYCNSSEQHYRANMPGSMD